jgi:hypothetical protein
VPKWFLRMPRWGWVTLAVVTLLAGLGGWVLSMNTDTGGAGGYVSAADQAQMLEELRSGAGFPVTVPSGLNGYTVIATGSTLGEAKIVYRTPSGATEDVDEYKAGESPPIAYPPTATVTLKGRVWEELGSYALVSQLPDHVTVAVVPSVDNAPSELSLSFMKIMATAVETGWQRQRR